MALKYVGKDKSTDWLPGVPTRDLEAEDLKDLDVDEKTLIASGLYEVQKAAPKGKE